MSPKTSTLLASLAGAAAVAAHGHVSHIVVNGVYYRNYDPTTDYYNPSQAPKVLGWSALNQDNGFVEPNNFGTSDVICHRGAAPGAGHATVAAGDKINLVWTPEWPSSHVGPVIDYLAECNGDCETVDKTSLRFFKIGGAGYSDGQWASEVLTNNGNSWLVQIPSNLKPGNYVLRHEIIALHGGPNPNGAQSYPQCLNIRVTGSGSFSPAGVPGTSLYTATDPGILFNTYASPVVYPVPGPALIAGAPASVAQSKSAVTSTGTATLPGGAAPTTAPTTTSTTSTAVPTTLVSSTRTSATTSSTSTAAPTPTGGATQTKYGQCGGIGWTGPTVCESGTTCNKVNDWYSQCL
ncbi:glycosyl hydrolase family 61-domain-containing protein [Cercophora newfieldiana]|uniref:lytic cellulose monooxygenase (C4-dehydrogenating) n=1 Tax=Cercophora newfieldiana TaxID=92897 RepID=A0AA39YGR3_9PEZI|nr:glycosyl hydrolase family 61-domain-containing protein [Cercophora newfieldiana]